ncbi:translation initiation factor IF-2 N-terminal domain-containing protein [Streptomyces murinus]|uniref:translation initiation factor IF-2 N-terminal domain-containing protein n=1 Tax=Streptomyces murinus TaxID=33900 RepID=UPI0038253427
MAKVRVYELAKEFGVESRVVLDRLHELGISARTASSSLNAPDVRRLVDALLGPSATTRAESLISRPFVGHADRVLSVAFSPDGQMLASAGFDGTVRLRNPATGEELHTLNTHSSSVLSVAFSPDGKMLGGGGSGGRVRLWNPATGEELHTLNTHSSSVLSVAFSPDGRTLASAGSGGVRMWDATTGEERIHIADDSFVLSVAFSPDGRTLASVGTGGVRLWDATTGEGVQTLHRDNMLLRSVAFSPDGRMLASAGADGVRLWDATTGEVQTLHSDNLFLRSVAFSPDSRMLASAGDDGVRLWDLAAGEERIHIADNSFVQSVAFSPDGRTLASAGDDGVRLRDPATGEELNVLTVPGGWATSVVFSPGGGMLASAGFDGTVRLWDATTGEELQTLNAHSGMVLSLAFSPDGAMLASAGYNDTVRLWSPATGEELHSPLADSPFTQSVVFSPDGRMLAAAGSYGVRLWNLATGEESRTFHARGMLAVDFSTDGEALAAASPEMVWVWSSRTGEELFHMPRAARQGGALSVAFSRDGTVLACADSEGVWAWNLSTGMELHTLSAQRASSVAFSPDDAMLASAHFDGTVRLRSTRTGEELRTLSGHTGNVLSVAFSPDDAMLASAGDGTIRIWDPFTGQQQAGTGFGEVSRLRPLPGLHSDTSSAEDLLGNATDVEMLAMLAAAHDTRPPLAIAVLGQWGAGKSSFMDQMRRQVAQLADLSANNPGRSAFASAVRQVRFNAWHYSDDHLWTGLVDHLFQSLAEVPGQGAAAADQGAVRAEREQLTGRLASLEEDQRRLHANLAKAKASRPGGFMASVGSPVEALQLPVLAARMVLRDAWRGRWAVLGVVVAVAVAYFGRQWLSAWMAALLGVVGLLTPVLLPVWATVRRWHRQGQSITGRLRAGLESRQRSLNEEVSAARSRLAEVDAAVRLSAFLTERSAPQAYQEYRGLLGQVHRDLVRLDEALKEARAQWELTRPATPPPLERIVLYIDDLDRCPPARVVEVLAAVHLMLALPLFVVVVAVDPRWLLTSLHHHYKELFAAAGGAEGPVELQDSATPLDYLDKIFQIPFAVPAASPEKTDRYLRALLGAPASASGPSAGTATAPSSAPQDAEGRGPSPSEHVDVTNPQQRPDTEPRAVPDWLRGFERLGDVPADLRGAVPDLQPEQLTLQANEIDFMARLGRLAPTPRAAKKLVNLYRLVRISIDRHDLPAFIGTPQQPGSHQVVQILLAALVGSPHHSTAIFEAILKADRTSHITQALRATPLDNAFVSTLIGLIDEISAATPVIIGTVHYRPWCARLARFSFHTRSLVEGQGS